MAREGMVGPIDLSEAELDRIDEVIDRFEAAWRAGRSPQVSDFAPHAGDPLREATVVQLIKVDQEHRWRSEPKPIEDYLHEWRELPARTHVELIEAECYTRAALGECPTRDELRGRFGPIAEDVDLEGIRAEVEMENRPGMGLLEPVAPPPLEVGGRFGPGDRYEIREHLGEGAMGWVYHVYDTTLQCPMALKIPKFDPHVAAEMRQRFRKEAQAAVRVNDPNVCRVFDAGQHGDLDYITMEYIAGERLDHWVKARPLEPREAAEIVCKIARGLKAVHEKGIVHRDIKPSNVMIDERGEPRLMDFGVARFAEEAGPRAADGSGPSRYASGGPASSTVGSLAGAIPYMAPELFEGSPADARSDIYGLGVSLFELLTNRLPFTSDGLQLVTDILYAEPPKPSELRPGVDPRLEAICLKAMAKEPAKRYQSADELIRDLEDYLQPAASPPRRWGRWLAAAAAAALLAAIVIYLKTGEGTLVLTINQADATVTIDGSEIHIDAPQSPISLSVGRHELKATGNGFELDCGSFTVHYRGATVRRDVWLPVKLEIETRWPAAEKTGALWASPDGSRLYVASRHDGNQSPIEVLSTSTGERLQTIEFGNNHGHGNLAVSSDGRYLYTNNFYQRYISRIDLSQQNARTDLPIGTVATHVWCEALGMTPDGRKLVAAFGIDGRTEDLNNDGVAIVDIAEGRFALFPQVPLDDEPTIHKIAFSADSKFAYLVTQARKSASPTLVEVSLSEPYQVTRTLAFPDGELTGMAVCGRLNRAFVSDAGHRTIHVVDLGTFEPISSIDPCGRSPNTLVLNATETLLAAISPDSREVLLLDPEDGRCLGFASGLEPAARDACFSPDGRRLYVAGFAGRPGVAVINLSRAMKIVFASDRAGSSFQLFTMDGAGRNPVQLTQGHAISRSPRWSPDGRRIAFISDRDGPRRIYIMGYPGGRTIALENTDPFWADPHVGAPLDWSPDGTQIAFIGSGRTRGPTAIKIVDVGGGAVGPPIVEGKVGPRGYTRFESLSWRRTDGVILFAARDPGVSYHKDLFLYRPDTREITQLTDDFGKAECSGAPVSSPDGKLIALLRGPNEGPSLLGLALMQPDGSGLRSLVDASSGTIAGPRWQPDGSGLVCAVKTGGHYHIWTIGVEPSRRLQLTRGEWDDMDPDACSVLPVSSTLPAGKP